MKKIFILSFSLLICGLLWAQNDNEPAARLAQHIADKMADSLLLTPQQRAKIFSINMELYKQKAGVRKKSADRTVVGKELQRIESTRDSFYKTVLTDQQYGLYLKKKRSLVNSK
jgi:hypothetical protein